MGTVRDFHTFIWWQSEYRHHYPIVVVRSVCVPVTETTSFDSDVGVVSPCESVFVSPSWMWSATEPVLSILPGVYTSVDGFCQRHSAPTEQDVFIKTSRCVAEIKMKTKCEHWTPYFTPPARFGIPGWCDPISNIKWKRRKKSIVVLKEELLVGVCYCVVLVCLYGYYQTCQSLWD